MVKRKGITPIIAVVLLILIAFVAVGSVAGLVTQFTDTDVIDQWESQQEVEQWDFEFSSVYDDNRNISMNVRYIGSPDVNASEDHWEMRWGPDGQEPVSIDILNDTQKEWVNIDDYEECINESGDFGADESFSQGDDFSCTSNVKFPDGVESVTIELVQTEHGESWDYDCDPSTSSDITC